MELIDRALLIVEEQVGKLVAEGSVEQLAQRFIAQGMKAQCANPRHCAIAVHMMLALDKELGAGHGLTVYVPGGTGMTEIAVGKEWPMRDNDEWQDWPAASFAPGILGEFAYSFDLHEYTELEL